VITKIEVEQAERMRLRAVAAVDHAKIFQVDNAAQSQDAADFLHHWKDSAKKIEKERKRRKESVVEAARAIDGMFMPTINLLGEAAALIGKPIIAYDREQARIKREAELKAEREAQQERLRLAEEQAALERKIKKEQEAIAKLKTPEAKERHIAKVEDMAAQSDSLYVQAQSVVAAPVASEYQRPAGLSVTTKPVGKIIDLRTFFLAASQFPDDVIPCFAPIQGALNALAKKLGDQRTIPGFVSAIEHGTRSTPSRR